MNGKTDIALLLTRYYDGETSLREEQELHAYFSRPEKEIPPEWREERRIFLLLAKEKMPAPPEGMEARIEKQLDFLARAEQPEEKRQRVFARRTWLLWPAAAAAVAAVCYFSISSPRQEIGIPVAQAVKEVRTPDRPHTVAAETVAAASPTETAPLRHTHKAKEAQPPHSIPAGTTPRTEKAGTEEDFLPTLTPEEGALLEKGLQLFHNTMQKRQDIIASAQENIEQLHREIQEKITPLYHINL